MKCLQTLSAVLLLFTPAGFWFALPWLSPLLFPVQAALDRPALLVVLDGTPSRLEQAEQLAAAIPKPLQRLLIRCPSSPPPSQPMPELLQGYDTTTQVTALADWLRYQPAPLPRLVWIATDPDHAGRAVLLTRLALAGRGVAVAPMLLPAGSTAERLKLLRDALRLSLWRVTGSTGDWLVPDQVARKSTACGV